MVSPNLYYFISASANLRARRLPSLRQREKENDLKETVLHTVCLTAKVCNNDDDGGIGGGFLIATVRSRPGSNGKPAR